MKNFLLHRPTTTTQYLISILLVIGTGLLGLALQDFVGYRVIAFILMVMVSVLAMFLDIMPVVVAAFLSALIWDFLFIPPKFTLSVGQAEDRLLLLMYFIIAMVNAALTTKVRQVERQLRAKNEKARSVNFYNTLLNSLSHELRTPITTIVGATDNLLSSPDKVSNHDKKELLKEISIAAVRLNQQVENLLSMSRLESGILQIKKDWCDIHDLVYKTLNQLEPSLQRYKVAVYIPENFPLFKLDFGLMEQVLYNLINNAIQHTPEDTMITVQAECSDETLVITIADNGHGFPPEEIDKVFNKFYRVKGSRPGGTGLGLSIVKGFVEAHDGKLKLENLPIQGSKFTIEILTEKSHVTRLKE